MNQINTVWIPGSRVNHKKLYKSGLRLIWLPIGVHIHSLHTVALKQISPIRVGPSVQPYESLLRWFTPSLPRRSSPIFYSHVLHTHYFSRRLFIPLKSDYLTWEWPTVQTYPDWSESIIFGQSTLKSRHRPYRSIRAISPMVRASWTQYGFHY